MSSLKHKFLFIVLTCSAYISPLLMVLSLWSNYWLLSTELIPLAKENMVQSGLAIVTATELGKIAPISTTPPQPTTTYNSFFPPTYPVYANYGVWQFCKTSDPPRDKISCQYIKYFKDSDSESDITDTIKGDLGRCLIIFLFTCVLMKISLMIHTYAIVRGEVQYLFLISGCFFIFAGLFSLTGLVVFIAAINGAVDSKMTLNSSNKDEPVYQYSYGISFYCAVTSFLFQELNGICNIYWYMGHYRKIKLAKLRLTIQEETKGMVQQISRSPEKSNKMYKAANKSVSVPIDKLHEDEVFEKSETTQRGTPTKRDKVQVLLPGPSSKSKLSFKKKANLIKNVNIATRRENSHSVQENMILSDINLNNIKTSDEPNKHSIIDNISITGIKENSPDISPVESASSHSSPSLTTSDIDSTESHTSSSLSSTESATESSPTIQARATKCNVKYSCNCPHKSPRHHHHHPHHQKQQQQQQQPLSESQNQMRKRPPITHQSMHISFEEDDLTARFYRLDREINNSNKIGPNTVPLNYTNKNNQSGPRYDPKKQYVIFPAANRYVETKYRSVSGQPCIHKILNPSKSYYDVNSTKMYPGQYSNYSQNQQLHSQQHQQLYQHQPHQQQSCLYAPSLSYKDICSNSKIVGDYSVDYANPKANNMHMEGHPFIPSAVTTSNSKSYQNWNPSGSQYYNNNYISGSQVNHMPAQQNYTTSVNDLSTYVNTNNANSMNYNNSSQHHQHNQQQRSKLFQYPNANAKNINQSNYSHVIPILKQQQPVSLSMMNATNAAAQAAQSYLNYGDNSSHNNYSIDAGHYTQVSHPGRITHRKDLSSTLPNLFSVQDGVDGTDNYKAVTKIVRHDVIRNVNMKPQQQQQQTHGSHRINRRVDYELNRAGSGHDRLMGQADYLPVTRYVEDEAVGMRHQKQAWIADGMANAEAVVVVDDESEHKSRSMESGNQQNLKRTTSV